MEFSGEDFSVNPLDSVPEEAPEPSKGGRPTIADNFLLGSRNQWRTFFERGWPDVGWPLSQICKRRSSTIKDVQKVFEGVAGKPLCDHANVFLRGAPETTTVQACRKLRIKSNKLGYELQDMQRAHQELERSVAEVKNALQLTGAKDRVAIQKERRRRQRKLRQHKKTFAAKQRECVGLEKQVRDGETYLYCYELLDFVRSRRRALTPINLADALAGLPDMRWRQSDSRCSKMPADSYAQHPYAIFQLIERLLKRIRAKRSESLTGEFQAELLKLPKNESYPRDSICEQWRDFRLAVEEVSKSRHQSGFIPYAITSAFLRNVSRQKTSVDNVLDVQERLTLKTK